MSIALSVRQKLIAIVVLVCVGYAGFGDYSIYNLSQMSNASDDATELSRLTSEVKDVEIALLQFEREMATLSPDNVDAISQTLVKIKNETSAGFSIRADLLDTEGKARLRNSQALQPNYLSALESHLQNLITLG
ncbi:hypothetical protein [Marinomonas lutimaris]|uniref:hypothetical protein n=1 Tax=Marinomonas lutimaris TaxID=2846746 RepID=UPI001CA5B8DF|nr:hypothetical protein [Marinomonas lutimaris]